MLLKALIWAILKGFSAKEYKNFQIDWALQSYCPYVLKISKV